MATYDGINIFGVAVKVRMIPAPSASQPNEFFGLSGIQCLYGGARGRVFLIDGLLLGSDASDLAAQIDALLSYDDGLGRVLVDSLGVAWPGVVFRRFEPGEKVLYGPCLQYKAVFEGLI